MQAKEFLMIPGPTPVPDAVLEALSRSPLGHRTKDFSKILLAVSEQLKTLAACEDHVFLLTGSGTAAMEAAIANVLSPGDQVLSLVCGVFGNRWAKIAASFGMQVDRLIVPPGEAITVQQLAERLEQDKGKQIKAVTLTHNETSTGVINNLPDLVSMIKKHGALAIVDAVTSFGAVPIDFSAWGVDIMVAGSQKALMLPPGLAVIFCSQAAMKAADTASCPRFYLDLPAYAKSLANDTTPFTPNVSLVVALKTALDMIFAAGSECVYQRHERMKKALRAGLTGMGLSLLVPEAYASPTITAVLPPDGITPESVRRVMMERFQIRLADGQDELKGKIFRIGHMGYVFERDVLMTLACLEASLVDLGLRCPAGIGVGSALPFLSPLQG